MSAPRNETGRGAARALIWPRRANQREAPQPAHRVRRRGCHLAAKPQPLCAALPPPARAIALSATGPTHYRQEAFATTRRVVNHRQRQPQAATLTQASSRRVFVENMCQTCSARPGAACFNSGRRWGL